MIQQSCHKNSSEFIFQSNGYKMEQAQFGKTMNNKESSNQNFQFNINSIEQQLAAFQQDHQNDQRHLPKKHFVPIKKEQLEKIFKYFRNYEPIYFNRVIIKELSYKFKKGVFIKKYKEGFYFGEVQKVLDQQQYSQKIKQGRGIFVYNLSDKNGQQNKRIYEGEWRNDKKNGLGFQKFIDGSVYHGHYHDNKPGGRGKFTNFQGQIYEGDWKDGEKQGKGFWQGVLGQTYMGEWRNGKANGYGVFVNQNGNRYEGEFKNGLKHGQGIQRFTNGDLYKGLFQNDQPHGYGQYFWVNKSYFKGNFSNGLRQGQGLWKKEVGNSDKYQGQYQNDKKWGYGVFTWANGNVFKGNYEADLRNGYGQMFWKDGNYYKGNWKNGIQNGKGQLFILRQGLRVGQFQNNQIVVTQYEQTWDDQQNQEDQIPLKEKSQKQLLRNHSKASNTSVKSNNFKFSALHKHKTAFDQRKSLNPIQSKISEFSFTVQSKNQRKKFFSQTQTGMKSVPLKSLINNNNQSLRYFSKGVIFKPEVGFRISQKPTLTQNLNQTLDGSRKQKNQKSQNRKMRILHSSFYLHKFKIT